MSRGLCAVALAAGISRADVRRAPQAKPLELDGNLLAVDNRTSSDWSDVEIWINQHYRITVADDRRRDSGLRCGLDAFVPASASGSTSSARS